jgi:autotransporter-associated beta strand protein
MHADENNDGSIMVCEDDEGEIECSSPISLPSAPYDTLTTGGGRSGDGGSGGDGIGSSGQSAIAIEAGVTVRGGDGGQGGVSLPGGNTASDGGDGGRGGNGITSTGTAATITNAGAVRGGNGGNGGRGGGGADTGGNGGNGGDGGIGVSMAAGATLTNVAGASITGGNAGAGGKAPSAPFNPPSWWYRGTDGQNGTAGVGVYFSSGDATLVNAGTVSGGLNQDGSRAAAVVFSGSNNTLVLGAGYAFNGKVVADPSGQNTLVFGGTGTAQFDLTGFEKRFQGFDALEKRDSSTWTLTGSPETFSGDLGVHGGTLVLTSAAQLNTADVIIGSAQGESALLEVTGTGTSLNLSGTLSVAGYGDDSLTVANGGRVNVGGDLSVGSTASVIAGSQNALTVSGKGSTLHFGGTADIGALLSVADGGAVQGGQLQIGAGDPGSDTAHVTVDGAGSLLNVAEIDVGSVGNGSLTVSNGASVGLAAGGSVLQVGQNGAQGTVNIGAAAGETAAAAGTIHSTVVLGSQGTLNLNHDTTGYRFDTTVQGNGTINFLGGTTTISGQGLAQFSGQSNIGNSSVVLTSSAVVGGTVAVNAGGTLSGSGTLGSTTVNSGGTIVAGLQSQLTVDGDLTLQSGATFNYGLGTSNAQKAASIQVNGDLTLNGATVNVSGTSDSALIGYHRLISYSGTLTTANAGLMVGETPITNPIAYSYAIDYAPNVVDLLVLPNGLDLLQVWGGNALTLDGGDGIWSASDQNWLDPLGGSSTLGSTWGQGYAVFRGIGGTVTLDGTQTAVGLQFVSGDYTITGGTALNLVGYSGNGITIAVPELRVLAGETATIASTITGNDGLEKTGDGLLVLSGSNSYSGQTIISAGTLQISAANNLGQISNGLTINNGTLQTTGTISLGSLVTLGGEAAFDVASDTELQLTGVISGSGSLTKQGDGTLLVENTANSWSGGTLIEAGTLRMAAGSAGALPNMTDYVMIGGTLDLNGNALTMSSLWGSGGTISIDSASLTVNQDTDTVFAGDITGAGASSSLTKDGDGILVLTGNNSFQGQTSILGGTLAIYEAQNIGTGAAAISISDATLATLGNITLARGVELSGTATIDTLLATALELSSDVSGSGALYKEGAGSLILSGDASHSGGTTIANGFLQIGNGGATGSIAGNIVNNGGLVFDRQNSYTYSGVVSGAGALIQAGAGTTVLTGENSYTGNTFIAGGTLQIGDGGTTGSVIGGVLNEGTLAVDRSDSYSLDGLIVGTGSFVQAGSGTTILTADNAYYGGTTIANGTLELGAGGNSGWIEGDVLNNGTLVFNRSDAVLFSGDITGNGAVNQIGAGTTVLAGDNTYTGGTNILSGALVIGNGGTSGAITGNVDNDGILAFNRSNTMAYAGTISGSGSVQQIGTGTTILTGSNSYTGATMIAAGRLQIGDGGTSGSITGHVLNDGTLAFNRSDTVTFDGMVWGDGKLEQAGTGTLVLTGRNQYGGGVSISSGTLQLGDGGESGTLAANVENSGHFVVNRSGTVVLKGDISGSGSFEQVGSGVTVLAGNNSYGGGTTVQSGTLVVGLGDTGSIAGNIVNNGTLAFNRSDSYSFSGAISGTGAFWQIGEGTTVLSGNNSYSGATGVYDGRLAVNGSIASSSLVTVYEGGELGGNGIVSTTHIDGGTLAPGNSIGTLTVNGDLNFTGTSTYAVEVSASDADRVNVTGQADLGGATVAATFAPDKYVMRRYTILNAEGGIGDSRFSTELTTDLPQSFTSSLSYDADNAYLDLTLNMIGLNVNQRNVSAALVGYFNREGQIPLAYGGLDAEGLTVASGELATAVQQTTVDAMSQFMATLTDPLVAGGAKTGASVESDPFKARWNVWGAGFGSSRSLDGDSIIGSHDLRSKINGVAVGADYRLSPDTLLGFAVAGGHSSFSLSDGLGSGNSDLFQLGLYGRQTVGNAYFSAALAYGWQDIETERAVALSGFDTLQAGYDANAWSGRLEAGYRFDTPWIGITPYAAGQFVSFDLPSYAETVGSGADTYALRYASKHETVGRGEMGLRADRSFALSDGVFTMRGRAAWVRNVNNDRVMSAMLTGLPGAGFVVNGASVSRDTGLASISAEMLWNNGLSLGAAFDAEFSGASSNYAGKGVLRYKW